MRLVYLDEAGTSLVEPTAVIGGVILHADKELVAAEDYLESLVEKYIPKLDREGFVFHCKDVFSGKKYFSDQEIWPWSRRQQLLADLAALPKKLDLPLCISVVHKHQVSEEFGAGLSKEKTEIGHYAVAVAVFLLALERVMNRIWPNEVAIVIAEDRQKVKDVIRDTHALFKSPSRIESAGLSDDDLPIRKVRDTVHFAKKTESRHLQIADTCAFITRGKMLGRNANFDPLYEAIQEMMLYHPKGFEPRARS